MADEREIFSILEDADGSGNAPATKQKGDAVSGNEMPVLGYEDLSGNNTKGPIRSEGDDVGDAHPSLVAKDSAGDLAYIPLDANGKIPVSQDDPGTTRQTTSATVAGIVGTPVVVAARTLTASKDHICSEAFVSSTKATKWELIQTDDATVTVLEVRYTGPGDYNEKFDMKWEFTTGATGTQSLSIRATQLRGPSTDLNAGVKVLEKA